MKIIVILGFVTLVAFFVFSFKWIISLWFVIVCNCFRILISSIFINTKMYVYPCIVDVFVAACINTHKCHILYSCASLNKYNGVIWDFNIEQGSFLLDREKISVTLVIGTGRQYVCQLQYIGLKPQQSRDEETLSPIILNIPYNELDDLVHALLMVHLDEFPGNYIHYFLEHFVLRAQWIRPVFRRWYSIPGSISFLSLTTNVRKTF